MVSGEDDHAVEFTYDDLDQSGQRVVEHFHGFDRGCQIAGVADHVAIGVVDTSPVELAVAQQFDRGIGDFARLHGRRLIERHIVARNLDIGFERLVDVTGPIAVPEEGHMAELLRLADSETTHPLGCEILAHRVIDGWGFDEIVARHVEIPVVLQQAGIEHVGVVATIKLGERLSFVRLGDLDGAIATEIPQQHGVTVGHRADWFTVIGNNERIEVLITFRFQIAVGFAVHDIDGFGRSGELSSDTMGVAVVASFDHGPVGAVTVHGDRHTSTAGRNTEVDVVVGVDRGQHLLGGLDVELSRTGSDIAPVEQDVEPTPSHTLDGGLVDDGVEMVGV